jgi:hypothetical protein
MRPDSDYLFPFLSVKTQSYVCFADVYIHISEASVCPDACVYNAELHRELGRQLSIRQSSVVYT